MKLVKQSVELLWCTPEPEKMIELAGRTAYKSEDKITEDSAGDFCGRMKKSGHHSVLEHASASIRITCDRGISHEIVRHRIASYTQECVAGDTELIAHRFSNANARSQKKWRIDQLYDWQFDDKRKGRIKLIRLRSVDSNGRIIPGKINEIVKAGHKQVYKVVCKSGRSIKTTLDHKFLTPKGYQKLQNLQRGSRIYANGIHALDNEAWLRTKYLKENNTLVEMSKLCGCCVTYVTKALRKFNINKPLGMRKNRKPGYGKKGMFSSEQLNQMSESKSKQKNPGWKEELVGKSGGYARVNRWMTPDICWGCGVKTKLERHHLDENPSNSDENNILFLCQKCHKAFHHGQGVLITFVDEIIAIDYVGEEQTYDIIMENNPHNYVANGLVVHNSTRYCNYSKDKFKNECSFIEPPGLTEKQLLMWKDSCIIAEFYYFYLLGKGCTPQIARSVLPTCLKTEIVMTCNLREWIHFIKLRGSKAAHPQIRVIANLISKELQAIAPSIF